MCIECYSDNSRITPLLNPRECLENHTQYICGNCGRCICIEKEPKRGLQRWHFPFKSLEIAKIYLRTADFSMKKPCGIYEILKEKGRPSYKIFADEEDLRSYLAKNKGKKCPERRALFSLENFTDYSGTEVRKLSSAQVETYLLERSQLRK